MSPRDAFNIIWSATVNGNLADAAKKCGIRGGPDTVAGLIALLKTEQGLWEEHTNKDRENIKSFLRNTLTRGRSEQAKVQAARLLADLLNEGIDQAAASANLMPTHIVYKTWAKNGTDTK